MCGSLKIFKHCLLQKNCFDTTVNFKAGWRSWFKHFFLFIIVWLDILVNVFWKTIASHAYILVDWCSSFLSLCAVMAKVPGPGCPPRGDDDREDAAPPTNKHPHSLWPSSRNACPFCHSKVLNYLRHLVKNHQDRPEVQRMLAVKCSNDPRRQASEQRWFIDQIKDPANDGAAIPCKRAKGSEEAGPKALARRGQCHRWYSAVGIRRHESRCRGVPPVEGEDDPEVEETQFITLHLGTLHSSHYSLRSAFIGVLLHDSS